MNFFGVGRHRKDVNFILPGYFTVFFYHDFKTRELQKAANSKNK